MIINYNQDVFKDFLALFPEFENTKHDYILYKGIEFSTYIDHYETCAGNQYIKIYTDWRDKLKIPMNTQIDKNKILKQLDKLVLREQERKNSYDKFQLLNKKARELKKASKYKDFIDIDCRLNITSNLPDFIPQYFYLSSFTEKDGLEFIAYVLKEQALYNEVLQEIENIKEQLENYKK